MGAGWEAWEAAVSAAGGSAQPRAIFSPCVPSKGEN